MDNDQFSNLDSLLVQLGPSLAHLTLDKPAKEGKPRGDLAKVLNMLERRKCEVCVQLLIGCATHLLLKQRQISHTVVFDSACALCCTGEGHISSIVQGDLRGAQFASAAPAARWQPACSGQ
jgi:hypothetical protein